MQNKILDTRRKIQDVREIEVFDAQTVTVQNAVVGKIYQKEYWRCQCPDPKEVGGQRSRLEWCNVCDNPI